MRDADMTPMETHNERIIDQFTRWARPFSELPLHSEAAGMARALAAVAPRATDLVLDVACGPGIVACAIAAQARHVTGIDLTPAMIAEARRRQAAMGLTNLDWQVGTAEALPFDAGSFDAVVTRYSFHHLQQPAAVLAEMARVCKPGGRITVIDATPAPDTRAAYDRMETIRDPSHASALTREELEALGLAAGLIPVSVESYRVAAILRTLAEPADLPALEALFDADIAAGEDRIGVAPWRDADGIHFYFPVSILAWRKPSHP